jgi:hypothetical protein
MMAYGISYWALKRMTGVGSTTLLKLLGDADTDLPARGIEIFGTNLRCHCAPRIKRVCI